MNIIRTNFKILSIIFSLTLILLLNVSVITGYSQAESEDGHSEHHYSNTVELFTGMTYEDGDHGSESGFSSGVIYERHLNNLFGVGIFAEYTAGDFEKWSFGVPVFIKPYMGFRFVLAPGIDHKDSEDEFLFRAGVGYEFELSEHWLIVPEFNVDFVDGEEAYVMGVALGYRF